jgi:hypothetical protein
MEAESVICVASVENRRDGGTKSGLKPILMGSCFILAALLGSSACDSSATAEGPHANTEADSLRLSSDCMTAGMRSYDHLKADLQEKDLPALNITEPKFHFQQTA